MQRVGISKDTFHRAVKSGKLEVVRDGHAVGGTARVFVSLDALGRYLDIPNAIELLQKLDMWKLEPLPDYRVTPRPEPKVDPIAVLAASLEPQSRREANRDVLGNIPDIREPGAFGPHEVTEEWKDSFGHTLHDNAGHRMFGHVEPVRGETQSHVAPGTVSSHEGMRGNDDPLNSIKGYEPGSEAYERDIAKWTREHGGRDVGSQRAMAMAAERVSGIHRTWPTGPYGNPMTQRVQRSNGQLDNVRADGATSGHTIQPTAQQDHSKQHPEVYAHLQRNQSK